MIVDCCPGVYKGGMSVRPSGSLQASDVVVVVGGVRLGKLGLAG